MEFECKHCETVISIDPEQMHNDVTCPACGDELDLPELPPKVVEALDKKLAEESNVISSDEGDHEAAEAMLEEPASKETTMWKEKLAASFQAANISNITEIQEEEIIMKPPALEGAIDTILDYFSIKRVEAFDEYYKTVSSIGGIFILIFGLLALAQCIFLTSKFNNILYLIVGIIGFISSFGLYYLASKFSHTGLALIRTKELVFYTRDMHHAFGLINVLATFILLLMGGYTGISEISFFYTILYIIPAIATAHAAILFLSPEVLNTRITRQDVTAGETGLSLIGFIIRVFILLSGILLAAIPVLGVVVLYIIFDTLNSSDPKIGEFIIICKTVALISLAPLATYLTYILYRIFLDLYKVIFQISTNLILFLDSLYGSDE